MEEKQQGEKSPGTEWVRDFEGWARSGRTKRTWQKWEEEQPKRNFYACGQKCRLRMEHPSFRRQKPQLQYTSGLFSGCVGKVASLGELIPAVELWAGLRRRGGCEPSRLQVSVVETEKDFGMILEY